MTATPVCGAEKREYAGPKRGNMEKKHKSAKAYSRMTKAELAERLETLEKRLQASERPDGVGPSTSVLGATPRR